MIMKFSQQDIATGHLYKPMCPGCVLYVASYMVELLHEYTELQLYSYQLTSYKPRDKRKGTYQLLTEKCFNLQLAIASMQTSLHNGRAAGSYSRHQFSYQRHFHLAKYFLQQLVFFDFYSSWLYKSQIHSYTDSKSLANSPCLLLLILIILKLTCTIPCIIVQLHQSRNCSTQFYA